jgi:hypothetical protein
MQPKHATREKEYPCSMASTMDHLRPSPRTAANGCALSSGRSAGVCRGTLLSAHAGSSANPRPIGQIGVATAAMGAMGAR